MFGMGLPEVITIALVVIFLVWKAMYRSDTNPKVERKEIYGPVSYSEFSGILEELKRAAILTHYAQLEPMSEAARLIRMEEIVNASIQELSSQINAEVERHGKTDDQWAVISNGGDIKDKLKFWNRHIPEFKKYLVTSCEQIARQDK